ncbi:PEGA domain-containing protein [Candidatus Fermentibacteria bacterium]|nr:PEGA domain-containing protein [Candidatus Fermentibacteria bacterium]
MRRSAVLIGACILMLAVSLAYAKPCPQCGTENIDEAKFCKQCGFEFAKADEIRKALEQERAALLERADSAYKAGRWEDALTSYRALLQKDSGNELAKGRIPECERKANEEKARRDQEARAAQLRREYDAWLEDARKNRTYRLKTARGLLDDGKLYEAGRNSMLALAGDWNWKEGRALLKEILSKATWNLSVCDPEAAFGGLTIAAPYKEELKQQALMVCREFAFGVLEIDVSIPGAEIAVDGRRIGVSPVEPESLAAGSHVVVARKEGYYDATESVEVQGGGEITRVSLGLRSATGVARILSNPTGARVLLDGTYAGTTPLLDLTLDGGQRQVVVESKGYERWSGILTVVEGETASLEAALIAKSKGKAFLRSALLPGSGQRYRDRTGTGWVYTVAQVVSAGAAVFGYSAYSSAFDEYEEAVRDYESSGSEQSWQRMISKHNDAQDKQKTSNLTLSLAVGVYVVNLVDALVF